MYMDYVSCRSLGLSVYYVVLVSYPAHVCLPVRNGLVNESQISWVYSQNVVTTNENCEIVNSLTAVKFCLCNLGIQAFLEWVWHKYFEHC